MIAEHAYDYQYIARWDTSVHSREFGIHRAAAALLSDGVVITKYRGDETAVRIPSVLEGKPVKAIGNGAFSRSSVKEVYVPEGVCCIGDYAFSHCQVASVHLPDTLFSIGFSSFSHSALTGIDLPKGLREVGKLAFYDCDALSRIRFSEDIIDLPEDILSATQNLTAGGIEGAFVFGERGHLVAKTRQQIMARIDHWVFKAMQKGAEQYIPSFMDFMRRQEDEWIAVGWSNPYHIIDRVDRLIERGRSFSEGADFLRKWRESHVEAIENEEKAFRAWLAEQGRSGKTVMEIADAFGRCRQDEDGTVRPIQWKVLNVDWRHDVLYMISEFGLAGGDFDICSCGDPQIEYDEGFVSEFLIDSDDVETYMKTKAERQTYGTPYAYGMIRKNRVPVYSRNGYGGIVDDKSDGTTDWWLSDNNVFSEGYIGDKALYENPRWGHGYEGSLYRPAIYVNLSGCGAVRGYHRDDEEDEYDEEDDD